MAREDLDFGRLEVDGKALAGRAHAHYLAELLAVLAPTSSADPIDGLALLHAMWGTGYAPRGRQREALDAVGQWYERRLKALSHKFTGNELRDQLRLEVGWVRRIAKWNDHAEPGDPGRYWGSEVSTPNFGRGLDALRRRLEQQSRGVERGGGAEESQPAPTELPERFEARFVNFEAAREAWRSGRKREKRGKPPKERRLPIEPVDRTLVELAAGLAVSTTATAGFGEYFDRVVEAGGGLVRFEVVGVDPSTRVVVRMGGGG